MNQLFDSLETKFTKMFNNDPEFKKTETETVQKQIQKLSIELDLIS